MEEVDQDHSVQPLCSYVFTFHLQAVADLLTVIIGYAVFWLDWGEDHPIGMVGGSLILIWLLQALMFNSSATMSLLASSPFSRRFLRLIL